MSKIYSALIDHTIRVYIADTTDMVLKAKEIHNTNRISTDALGRSLTASSILGKLLKNERDILTLKIKGTNQIKNILVTSDYHGNVKGYISNPDAEVYTSDLSQIHDAIGLGGTVTIIRDYGLKEPYVGISHMVSAEIDEDLAFYYKNSEQTPTDFKLKNIFEEDQLIASGGILVQLLPDASDSERALLKKVSKNTDQVVERMQNETFESVIGSLFQGHHIQILGQYEAAFKCDCSRERTSKALLTVGKEELKEILTVDKQADLKCHFCNTLYHFSEKDLVDMIEALNASDSE